jgi:hypothetical protein
MFAPLHYPLSNPAKPVAPTSEAAVSVADWVAHLSPEAMLQYVFTTYNSLLSWSALERLTNEDFATAAEEPTTPGKVTQPGIDTPSVTNLREALQQLYPGATCSLSRAAGQQRIVIQVPNGELESWPAQITQLVTQA